MSPPKRQPGSTQAVNGPLTVRPLEGEERFGRSGARLPRPLTVAVADSRGRPPTDRRGRPVPVTVAWEVVDAPGSARATLPPRGTRRRRAETAPDGLCSVPADLGAERGAVSVRASLPDQPDTRPAEFRIFTEGVAAELRIRPPGPVPAGRSVRARVEVRDWTGERVDDVELSGTLGYGFVPEHFPARRRGRGRFEIVLRSPLAARGHVSVIDARTLRRASVPVELVPGPPRTMHLREPENPRAAPPYRETQLDLEVRDRFGNLVPGPDVEWKASAGRVTPVEPARGASASARLAFGRARSARVTARVGRLTARAEVELPDVVLRPLAARGFSYTGETFRLSVEVFPPAGEGAVHGARLLLRQPAETAELVSWAAPEGAGVPEPRVSADGGLLRITVPRMDIPLTPDDEPVPLIDLTYRCTAPEEACFEVEEGLLMVHRSPGEPYVLNPGVRRCRIQKLFSSDSDLCLCVCLVTNNVRTFDQARAEAERHVERTQEILDGNIPVCCPSIDIEPCYRELRQADYQAVRGPNAQIDTLPPGPPPAALDPDPTHDAIPLAGVVGRLFGIGRCRVNRCHTVIFVPDPIFAGAERLSAATFTANDFPQTTPNGSMTLMQYGIGAGPGTLAHELGHALIDRPRPRVDEHVLDPDRLMWPNDPDRTGFALTQEECSRILDHIGRYDGSCD